MKIQIINGVPCQGDSNVTRASFFPVKTITDIEGSRTPAEVKRRKLALGVHDMSIDYIQYGLGGCYCVIRSFATNESFTSKVNIEISSQ